MTKILTLRIPMELLSKAEAQAARLGLDRAKYLRALIEQDLRSDRATPTRKFASEDLVGKHLAPESGQAATNQRVRERMREQQLTRRERNR